MIEDCCLAPDVNIPFPALCNIYGCEIGEGTFVGPFVEIQRGVSIGERCKIESHAFICSNVAIGDRVFVSHGVKFCNDRYPYIDRGTNKLEYIIIKDGAFIGTNATILPGITIGELAGVGAGAVVTRDVPARAFVAGNPAKVIRQNGRKVT